MKKIIVALLFLMFVVLSAEWTIVQTYSIPEGASGLAFDGTYLYCGIYGANGDEFYQIDPDDGTYQLLFTNPNIGDCFGMTWDGTNLWITDHENNSSIPASAIELDINSGTILSQFDLPDHYMSGIAYDNGDFWVATYYPDNPSVIYQVDNTGTVLQQFNFELPGTTEQPWDLCIHGSDLWIADYYDDALYKVDISGTILDSHSSESSNPAGIVWDGEYLWYCDNGVGYDVDYLYKVDLVGSGTPQISLGFDEYDFGNTTIGQPESVELPVTNTGTAKLYIISIEFTASQYTTVFQPPVIISPDETTYLPIIFEPDNYGEFPATMTISSNDPVNPEEEVALNGFGIFQEPEIDVVPTTLNFGSIRVGAFSGKFVEITNQGEADLIINTIEFNDTYFLLDNTFEIPITIETNETYNLRIWFNPEDAIDYNSIMLIYSNDEDENPVEVNLSGSGFTQSFPICELLWQYQITTGYDNSPKAITSIPDVSGDGIGDVIVCSEDNFIRCFNGNSSGTGDVLWEKELGSVYSQSGLTIIDDINDDDYNDVVVGTAWGDRSIHALSGLTGEIIWTHDTHEYGDGGWVYQVYVKYDYNDDEIPDVLAATGNDGNYTGPQRVYCLDGLTGNSIWEFYAPGPKFSVLGIEDATYDGQPDVICGASDLYESQGIVYGIDGETGNEIWSYNVSGSSVWALEQTSHLNWNGVKEIIAGDFSGNYYCLEGADGSLHWNGNIGTAIILRFIKLDDINDDNAPDFAIAHSGFHNALVIDGSTGDQIWNQPIADQPWNAARIADISGDGINDLLVGTLYSSNFGYFLNGVDGSELGSINIGTPVDAIASIPDIANDDSWEMVCGGRDGTVICISGGEAVSDSPDSTIPDPTEIAELIGNFPNPFNPETSINFNLKKDSNVSLKVFNIKGQLIKTLIDEELSASTYNVVWNGKNDGGNYVSSGIYLYQLQADTHLSVRKCILLK